jgi:hypothetical protein
MQETPSTYMGGPVPTAKVTGIQETQETSSTYMGGKSKIAKGGLAPRTRPSLRVKKSFEAATLGRHRQKKVPPKATKALPLPLPSQQVLTRRESLRKLSPPRILDNGNIAKCTKQRHDKPPVKTIQFQIYSFRDMGDKSKKSFETATLGGPRQEKVPPKARKALPLPLASKQVLTRQESPRKLSPPRILDNGNIAKCTKQSRYKPPVETVEFQIHSFTDMGDNSKKAKEAKKFISSYLQPEILYAACKIVEDETESGTSFETPTTVTTGRHLPTSLTPSCASSGWRNEIIYAACEIVEDDAESGTSFETPTIVKTGCQPPTSALSSCASSSGRRSAATIPKVNSAPAA